MYEFDKYEPQRHEGAPVSPAGTPDPRPPIEAMSMLIWGEHCIECAIPHCYATCDLYQSRPDGRCRRFTYGIYRNEQFDGIHGYGAEVSFKQWGKLETRGNTSMVSVGRLRLYERLWRLAVPVLAVAGRLLHAVTRDARWRYVNVPLSERVCRRLHRSGHGAVTPDAFLLEVYNPDAQPVRMMIEISTARREVRPVPAADVALPAFATTISVPPGYSRHELDRALFAPVSDSGMPFDVALIPEEGRVVTLVFLASDFVTYARPAGDGESPAVKCIVWDLDNTLWDGVLVEGDDVRVRPEIADFIRATDKRGVLHSIASKNDHATAWAVLEREGLAEYFLFSKINWQPKSANIAQTITDLNIGADSIAFIDDNAFEREEVKASLPSVSCHAPEDLPRLRADDRFRGSGSSDAASRRQYYRDAMIREQARTDYGDDYLAFLRSCEIRLRVRPFQESDFDRVAELVQRTNQLNFSGRKYDRHAIRELIDDASKEKYVMACSDRFGSYGTIGFGIVGRSGRLLEIHDLMLSCRIQGKFIEQAFLAHLCALHDEASPEALWVNFKATERNTPAREVLATMGFIDDATRGGLSRELIDDALTCDFIEVTN